MKILQVHNFYQRPGGEDVVLYNEGELLRDNGHCVRQLTVSNAILNHPLTSIFTAAHAAYSWAGRNMVAKALQEVQPDVVHVHNFFPVLTPSIYDACHAASVPVVQTLHNYRILCAAAHLYRNGTPCETCLSASPYQAVLHRCYRNSRLASLARMIDFHRRKDTWNRLVDCFIALTNFGKSRFCAGGIRPEKVAVKPNFVPDPGEPPEYCGRRTSFLYVGRLSPEKGVATLLAAWRNVDLPLHVIGDGPMRRNVQEVAGDRIAFLGQRPAPEVRQAMRSAACLIMPSEWYEGFPVVIAEAYANGLPVIASRLGAMKEVVGDGVTGLHFNPGDAEDLAEKVQWAASHPEEMRAMGRRARQTYEQYYTPQKNYAQLMHVYQRVIDNKARRTAQRG